MTLPNAWFREGYVAPATHGTTISHTSDPRGPLYGYRFRLKQDFNDTTFNAAAKIVITAMKHYGACLFPLCESVYQGLMESPLSRTQASTWQMAGTSLSSCPATPTRRRARNTTLTSTSTHTRLSVSRYPTSRWCSPMGLCSRSPSTAITPIPHPPHVRPPPAIPTLEAAAVLLQVVGLTLVPRLLCPRGRPNCKKEL